MTPNVLFVGCDKGAWQIRGKQLGAVLGAHYTAKPQPQDWDWADIVVLVKRAPEVWYQQAKAWGGPLVWDVLDFWRQPRDNQRAEHDLLDDIRRIRESLPMALVIGATKAMAQAIGGVYVPHHRRLGLTATRSLTRAEVVGYEGSPRYLGVWQPAIERACAELGLNFVLNPADLGHVDLVVAFRGGDWDGWVCRRWKSGVKYVNAIAAGRPVVTQACAAFDEIAPVGTTIEHHHELVEAFRTMLTPAARQAAYEQSLRRIDEFSIDTVAAQYRPLLNRALLARSA